MRDFKKYEVWQISHEMTLKIYSLTNSFPKDEIFGLISQLRRAASSIPTNIAEGCGRNSDKEFNQFLNIALGSALETEYLLLLSNDLNYLKAEVYQDLDTQINAKKKNLYVKRKIRLNPQ